MEWIEINVGELRFRTPKERTFLAKAVIEKTFYRDGAIGAHDIVKADCQLYDRKSKTWIQVTDADLELIGGYEPARTLILKSLQSKKHVVTANKAVIAKHGYELFQAARANKVGLY